MTSCAGIAGGLLRGFFVSFVYINKSKYLNKEIIKIGISNNPDKRLREFNCGVRHRYKGGHIEELCLFKKFAQIKLSSLEKAKKVEKFFIANFKKTRLRCFGREVFLSDAKSAHKFLMEILDA